MLFCKLFIWHYLDYSATNYDQPNSESLTSKIECTQYGAALAIAGAAKRASRDWLYQGLGLDSLGARFFRRLVVYFLKILKNTSPKFL